MDQVLNACQPDVPQFRCESSLHQYLGINGYPYLPLSPWQCGELPNDVIGKPRSQRIRYLQPLRWLWFPHHSEPQVHPFWMRDMAGIWLLIAKPWYSHWIFLHLWQHAYGVAFSDVSRNKKEYLINNQFLKVYSNAAHHEDHRHAWQIQRLYLVSKTSAHGYIAAASGQFCLRSIINKHRRIPDACHSYFRQIDFGKQQVMPIYINYHAFYDGSPGYTYPRLATFRSEPVFCGGSRLSVSSGD